MIVSFRQTDEVPLSLLVDDDSSDWWGGAQRCFAVAVASAALAASLLTAGISRQVPVDEQTPTLSAPVTPVDEDYWTAPPPVQAVLWQKLPLGDPEEIPGTLSGQPDEDYWVNPTAPVPASVFQRLPYLMDAQDDPAGTLRGQPDEDYWLLGPPSSPASVYQRFPYLFDPEEIPAGSLFGQDDDDFWENPVAAVPAVLYQRLPLGDPEELPAGNLFGQDDEDFWINPVAPESARLYQRLPYIPDAEELNAGTLFGPVEDEDFWVSGVAPVLAANYQRLPVIPDPEEIPFLTGQQDEDFWTNPVAPAPAVLYQRLPLGDTEELPAGSLFGQDDEDLWQNAVAPVPAVLYQRLPYLPDPEELNAGTLFGPVQDEDLWVSGVAPVAASLYQRLPVVPDPEEIPFLRGQLEDEYWQNPTASVPASLYQRLPLGDPEELPSGSFFGEPEEYFYSSPILVTPTVYPQQFAFDPVDYIPTSGNPDDDYWANPTAPVVGSLWQALPIGDREELPAGNLKGQPDEDFWQSGVAPVASIIYQRLPILFDPEELNAGSLFGPVEDEDYWVSGVAPVQAIFYQALPYQPDTNESPSGNLFGQADAQTWTVFVPTPSVTSVPRVFTDDDPLPLVYVLDEDAGRIWVSCDVQRQVQAFTADDKLPVLSLDEDYWQRFPTNGQTFQIPIFGFSDEVKGFVLQPDEDFWILRVTSTGYAPFRHVAFAPDWDTIGGLFIPAGGSIIKGSAVSKVTGRAIQIVRADGDQRIKGK